MVSGTSPSRTSSPSLSEASSTTESAAASATAASAAAIVVGEDEELLYHPSFQFHSSPQLRPQTTVPGGYVAPLQFGDNLAVFIEQLTRSFPTEFAASSASSSAPSGSSSLVSSSFSSRRSSGNHSHLSGLGLGLGSHHHQHHSHGHATPTHPIAGVLEQDSLQVEQDRLALLLENVSNPVKEVILDFRASLLQVFATSDWGPAIRTPEEAERLRKFLLQSLENRQCEYQHLEEWLSADICDLWHTDTIRHPHFQLQENPDLGLFDRCWPEHLQESLTKLRECNRHRKQRSDHWSEPLTPNEDNPSVCSEEIRRQEDEFKERLRHPGLGSGGGLGTEEDSDEPGAAPHQDELSKTFPAAAGGRDKFLGLPPLQAEMDLSRSSSSSSPFRPFSQTLSPTPEARTPSSLERKLRARELDWVGTAIRVPAGLPLQHLWELIRLGFDFVPIPIAEAEETQASKDDDQDEEDRIERRFLSRQQFLAMILQQLYVLWRRRGEQSTTVIGSPSFPTPPRGCLDQVFQPRAPNMTTLEHVELALSVCPLTRNFFVVMDPKPRPGFTTEEAVLAGWLLSVLEIWGNLTAPWPEPEEQEALQRLARRAAQETDLVSYVRNWAQAWDEGRARREALLQFRRQHHQQKQQQQQQQQTQKQHHRQLQPAQSQQQGQQLLHSSTGSSLHPSAHPSLFGSPSSSRNSPTPPPPVSGIPSPRSAHVGPIQSRTGSFQGGGGGGGGSGPVSAGPSSSHNLYRQSRSMSSSAASGLDRHQQSVHPSLLPSRRTQHRSDFFLVEPTLLGAGPGGSGNSSGSGSSTVGVSGVTGKGYGSASTPLSLAGSHQNSFHQLSPLQHSRSGDLGSLYADELRSQLQHMSLHQQQQQQQQPHQQQQQSSSQYHPQQAQQQHPSLHHSQQHSAQPSPLTQHHHLNPSQQQHHLPQPQKYQSSLSASASTVSSSMHSRGRSGHSSQDFHPTYHKSLGASPELHHPHSDASALQLPRAPNTTGAVGGGGGGAAGGGDRVLPRGGSFSVGGHTSSGATPQQHHAPHTTNFPPQPQPSPHSHHHHPQQQQHPYHQERRPSRSTGHPGTTVGNHHHHRRHPLQHHHHAGVNYTTHGQLKRQSWDLHHPSEYLLPGNTTPTAGGMMGNLRRKSASSPPTPVLGFDEHGDPVLRTATGRITTSSGGMLGSASLGCNVCGSLRHGLDTCYTLMKVRAGKAVPQCESCSFYGHRTEQCNRPLRHG